MKCRICRAVIKQDAKGTWYHRYTMQIECQKTIKWEAEPEEQR